MEAQVLVLQLKHDKWAMMKDINCSNRILFVMSGAKFLLTYMKK